MDVRKQCEFCGEVLGHSAYYRHLHDENGMICHGRMHVSESDHGSTSDFSFDEDLNDGFEQDSSFDFGSEPEYSLMSAQPYSNHEVHADDDRESEDASDAGSLMSFTSSLNDGEEIWDLLNSEDELENVALTTNEHDTTATVKGILYGAFLFLNFFQLFYRVSERAMIALLGFFQVLFGYNNG